MADVLVWVMEHRMVLSKRVERLRKEPAETEAEVARLEAAEAVFVQYTEDRDAGHPNRSEWDAALEEATGGEASGSVLLTPGRAERCWSRTARTPSARTCRPRTTARS
ncbi:hypothetical protein T261_6823 [Streptomyces lydicus]|nr:hypothetical protein T261_6823 [Streptomyces lydicus]